LKVADLGAGLEIAESAGAASDRLAPEALTIDDGVDAIEVFVAAVERDDGASAIVVGSSSSEYGQASRLFMSGLFLDHGANDN
jgi:hypothetical protein